MKNKLWVLGLGPGHAEYILPITKKKLEASDMIIGGKRHLKSVPDSKAHKIPLMLPLTKTIEYVKAHYQEKQISIIVSGDTGYYSLLKGLLKHFSYEQLEVYPGISSLQYFFARLGMTYDDAYLSSLHGREIDLENLVKKHNKVGLLTDKVWTPSKIAETLLALGLKKHILFVGENLSYEDERITQLTLEEACLRQFSSLCVVVIAYE